MSVLLVNANALHIPLADRSVQCVVTSPPYWGLRDYGVADQLGLEPTPEEYTAHMVEVFREVWRVLRDDGVLFLNLGDSYASDIKGSGGPSEKQLSNAGSFYNATRRLEHGLKPKDLVGIPWRVAFALQADGWYLRSEIIWHKLNPMPESVVDRPTKSHEQIFLLTKQQHYFYDSEAVKEPVLESTIERYKTGWNGNQKRAYPGPGPQNHFSNFMGDPEAKEANITAGRNRRTVWTIATEPTSEAHFATYPRALVEPCIKAGSAPGDVILDPFAGSGTTGIVARQLGRHFIGLDLSLNYLTTIARKRLGLTALEAWTEGIQAGPDGYHDLPLFEGAK